MSTQVQFRRGNTAQTASFTGAIAEITVDTDKKVVVVHDGTTAGGYALARESSVTANNQLSQAAFNTANAAFLQANTPSYTANSASTYANGAFVAANTADAKAVTSGSYANSAFATANNEAGVNATQNNSITAAFTTANSAGVYANGAFAKANTDVTGISAAAGTYGSSSTVPIVTLEANGRISSVTTTTIVASDPSAIAFAIALG